MESKVPEQKQPLTYQQKKTNKLSKKAKNSTQPRPQEVLHQLVSWYMNLI